MCLIYYYQPVSILIVRLLYEEYIFDLAVVLRKAMMQWLTNLKQTCDWLYSWPRKRKKVDAFLSKINIEDYAGSHGLVLRILAKKFTNSMFSSQSPNFYMTDGKEIN